MKKNTFGLVMLGAIGIMGGIVAWATIAEAEKRRQRRINEGFAELDLATLSPRAIWDIACELWRVDNLALAERVVYLEGLVREGEKFIRVAQGLRACGKMLEDPDVSEAVAVPIMDYWMAEWSKAMGYGFYTRCMESTRGKAWTQRALDRIVEQAVAPMRLERDTALARVERLSVFAQKVNDIRNSIIGAQTVNWSAHIYPLVAALEEAGIQGDGYAAARSRALTLIEQRNAAIAERNDLRLPRRGDEDLRESTDAPVFLIQRRRFQVTDSSRLYWCSDHVGYIDLSDRETLDTWSADLLQINEDAPMRCPKGRGREHLSEEEAVDRELGEWAWDTEWVAFTRAEAQAWADSHGHRGTWRVFSVPAMGELRTLLRTHTDYEQP